jgi:hypothetical protein
MEKRLAQIISIVFHPILIPTYGMLLLLSIDTFFTFQIQFKAKVVLMIMMLSSTVLIPMILFFIFKRTGLIDDIYMKTKEERQFPYLSLTIIYFLLYFLFAKTELHPIFSFFLLTTTLISLVLLLMNQFWKISAHTAGIGGLTAMMIGLSSKLQIDLLLVIAITIFFSGMVGFARLKTNSHKPAEVYSGYLAGAMIFLIMFLLF